MGSKKYVKDYVIEEDYDPVRKRFKTRAVYRGSYYRFVHLDEIRKIRFLYLGLSLVNYLAYVGVLVINAPCCHVGYTTVPLALLMLPFIFLAASDFRLITAKDKMTREHKDKITVRFRVVTMAQSILAAAALIGHIVYSILVGDTLLDIIFYVLAAVILAASLTMFLKRSLLDTEELIPGVNAPEEEDAASGTPEEAEDEWDAEGARKALEEKISEKKKS